MALPNLTPFIYPCLRALTHSCAAAILISFSLNLFWRFLLRGWWMLITVHRMRIEVIYIGWFLPSNVWYGKSTDVKVWLQTTCNWQLMSHRTFLSKLPWFRHTLWPVCPQAPLFSVRRSQKVTSKIIQQRFFGMFRIHSKICLPLNMTS